MLKHHSARSRLRRAGQRGVVLLVALVVLVAITIAGISMMRSVDTATLVAGNLAFQQAATHAADKGIEEAITMLRQKALHDALNDHDPSSGYFATQEAMNPASESSWQEFWKDNLASSAYDVGEDQFKNHIYYVVHRLCANTGPPGVSANCVESPAVTTAKGNSEEAGEVQLQSASQVYYRVTVRVSGPRKTESYVQSHIAL